MNSASQPIVKSAISPVIPYAGTLFLSAILMFTLQPMFGKSLLPLLGGTPAVWNTCMVFYQTLLFLGYLYAHWLSARHGNLRQIRIHGALLLLSLLALPVALPQGAMPPTDGNPAFWLIRTLFVAIGIPFFMVSSTAPLLQKWFSDCGHRSSHDPYFLYAASNAGSLLALLSYPFLLEPQIGLADQRLIWTAGYGLLCLAIFGCALLLWRSQATALATPAEAVDAGEPPARLEQLHWLVLAFVPSSLLLGLTQFISTDIASVPLLWIVPLTLYLLSFILVFSKWADRIHPLMLTAQPALLLVFIAYSFINPAVLPYWLDLILHSLAFFLAIMVCHGELAKRRPHPQHLTRFYLIMSFGGMLGGMFNTFIAPFIFNSVYEYPIMIVAALLLRPGFFAGKWYLDILFPLLVLIFGLGVYGLLSDDRLFEYMDIIGGALILLTGLTYTVRNSPLALGSLTGVILVFTLGLHGLASNTLYQQRSFFGVLSVRETIIADENKQPETVHELYHGTTKHGAERLTAAAINTPLTYYSRPGPIGQLFAEFDKEDQHWKIGSVGLGAGALACYAREGQEWRFYEIDPLVVDVAKNPAWFHYLDHCNRQAEMVIGDARLSLAREPDHSFDLLIMDAFSSDAVPTHLLTREALELYLRKLKDDGLLAFHISNRHLDLTKVLADHVHSLHLSGVLQKFKPVNDEPLVVATDWVVIAKNPQRLLPLQQSRLGHWQKLPLSFGLKPWTDDFTNIIGIWK
ncbi:MAG: fused MFS/spermidine synthase [Methylococcales bacterium]|nr:fused MFS/spermidine synthase [Methylococcales bacterium]